jgi:acetyl esterase
MPLDPLVRAFLDQIPFRPKAWEVTDDAARAGFAAMVKASTAKDVPIGKVENTTMPGPGGPIALRLYTPVAAGGEALPTLIYFHGGAFRIGDFETYETTCRLLAVETSCRVIAVDYRRAPENPFPAALDDAAAAVAWIETNATTLGIDPNRIAVGGDSAGANLATVVCQLAAAAGQPHILYQMLLFPVTQLGSPFPSMTAFGEGYGLDRDSLEYCYGLYAPKEQWNDPRVSPLQAENLAGLPPAFVLLAECDPLHDEGLAYADKMRAAGVAVTLVDWPGVIHDFVLYQAMLPQAREALVEAARAVKEAFDRF